MLAPTGDRRAPGGVAAAKALCKIDASPRGIVRLLALDDEIAVARPILMHSQQLCDADLVENATSKSQEHLLAIAQRLELSDAVTDTCAARPGSGPCASEILAELILQIDEKGGK